jgi:hypothetical protein
LEVHVASLGEKMERFVGKLEGKDSLEDPSIDSR